MSQARFILLGGFLGAGKTTALAALADHLAASGQRVGVITNDHGSELVDTAVIRAQEFAVEEVCGGGFGGRFDPLFQAAKKLSHATAPEVILAEAAGSCTDLLATVIHPLRKLHGDVYTVAPLCVLIDPLRAERMLGLASGGTFSEKLLALLHRQLEEAALIVIAKADLIDEARLDQLRVRLAIEFSSAQIHAISTRTGLGLKEWFALLENVAPHAQPVPPDDGVGVEGEALLGWLNSTIEFYGAKAADPQALLTTLSRRIQTALPGIEIAHFKIALRPDGSADIAVIQSTRRNEEPEVSRRINPPVDTGELTINLRAEATPEALHTALRQAVVELTKEFPGLKTEFAHLHYFRPVNRPPTHRMTSNGAL